MASFADTMLNLLGHANGNGSAAHGRIENLCRQVGWSIDGRDAKKITLTFNDPLVGTRPLYISHGDEPVVLFAAYGLAMLPAARVPDEVAGYLLTRNASNWAGAWEATIDDEGDAIFSVQYPALGDGLTASLFKTICEKMVIEAAAFDAKMHEAGLFLP